LPIRMQLSINTAPRVIERAQNTVGVALAIDRL
jgi:hypothetical protein